MNVVGDLLVDDEHSAAGRERAAGGAQRLDGAGHVVQRLEEEDEVVRAVAGELGGVGFEEADAPVQTRVSGVAAGVRDRAGVGVEPVDVGVEERLGDRRSSRSPGRSRRRRRARPAVSRRATTSGIAASHSVGSSWVNAGRLMWPWPWRKSRP